MGKKAKEDGQGELPFMDDDELLALKGRLEVCMQAEEQAWRESIVLEKAMKLLRLTVATDTFNLALFAAMQFSGLSCSDYVKGILDRFGLKSWMWDNFCNRKKELWEKP